LFLALLGIAVLLYAVRGSPTPTIKIGSIGATMNYGYVRLEGLVTRGNDRLGYIMDGVAFIARSALTPKEKYVKAPANEKQMMEMKGQGYEAGRFDDVVARVAAMPTSAMSPRDAWFAAQSYMGLRRTADARGLFERVEGAGDDGWRATARLALAVLGGNAADIDAARGAAAAYPAHPFAQYQLGIAHLNRDAPADAASALDRAAEAEPSLAHAYYYAGLAYQRLNRVDLMANRFETFLRLAPDAPQRPEVQAIMSTIRGQ
jgi:tetratricopeptide (TPR) repeat protein